MALRPAFACTAKRWATAQGHEIGYWETVASSDVYVEQVKWPWYREKASRLDQLLRDQGVELRLREGTIVELGAGPIGVAPLLTPNPVLLVDPLARVFAKTPAFARFRPGNAHYVTACGEAIPLGGGMTTLLIAENCLDHVQDIGAVISEIRRVLQRGGLLYLTVNCRSRLGRVMHRALAKSGLDAGHPHSLLPQDVVALLEAEGFTQRSLEIESFRSVWWNDLLREGARGKLKAVLGVSEMLLSGLFEKTQD